MECGGEGSSGYINLDLYQIFCSSDQWWALVSTVMNIKVP
jgi:hypothetical protein